MDEEVTLLKMLWTQPSVSYDGKFYQLKGAQVRPRPLQQPHPKFYLGGGSRQAYGFHPVGFFGQRRSGSA